MSAQSTCERHEEGLDEEPQGKRCGKVAVAEVQPRFYGQAPWDACRQHAYEQRNEDQDVRFFDDGANRAE